jgi:hypothetical protein
LFNASASTKLESTKILLPSTNPASTHCQTIRSVLGSFLEDDFWEPFAQGLFDDKKASVENHFHDPSWQDLHPKSVLPCLYPECIILAIAIWATARCNIIS